MGDKEADDIRAVAVKASCIILRLICGNIAVWVLLRKPDRNRQLSPYSPFVDNLWLWVKARPYFESTKALHAKCKTHQR